MDRKRKKKGSNEEWRSPADPDARITKMKDGRTHLAHKAEHAVDLSSGALLAIMLEPANEGDTTTVHKTLAEAQSVSRQIHPRGVEELVADEVISGGIERCIPGASGLSPGDRHGASGTGKARRLSRSGRTRIGGAFAVRAASDCRRSGVS